MQKKKSAGFVVNPDTLEAVNLQDCPAYRQMIEEQDGRCAEDLKFLCPRQFGNPCEQFDQWEEEQPPDDFGECLIAVKE